MVKVINKLKYDTESSDLICTYKSKYSHSGSIYDETSLYVTKKGNYFISGEGGPLSRWAESNAGGTSGGSGIIPLSKEGALEFAEKYADIKAIDKYFSDIVKDA